MNLLRVALAIRPTEAGLWWSVAANGYDPRLPWNSTTNLTNNLPQPAAPAGPGV